VGAALTAIPAVADIRTINMETISSTSNGAGPLPPEAPGDVESRSGPTGGRTPGTGAETRAALRHLATAVGVLLACAAATYALPRSGRAGVERLVPWLPGDPVPLARLANNLGAAGGLPAFAGAGGAYRPPGGTDGNGSAGGETAALGGAVSRELDALGAEEPGDAAGRRERGDDGQAGRDDQAETAPPGLRIDPDEYAGVEVSIERPGALRSFFDALEQTGRDRPGALTRIAHYGDSSIATDLITYTLRRKLQRRFGDGGHGFILIARGTMPYAHRDVRHGSEGDWELRQLVMNQDRDGQYGYGGVKFRARVGPSATFATDDRGPVGGRVSRFEVFYLQHPTGGEIRLTVDDGEPQTLDTSGETEASAFHVIDVPDGPHELELQAWGSGLSRLFGVVMERDGPGVVYDSLGLVGARARRLLNYDPEHIRAQIGHRDPNLLVLGFGGNDADDPVVDGPRYEREFVEVIRRMRGPRGSRACLVMAPLDQAQRNERGRVETLEAIPTIIAAQRAAAAREGCAFFDTFAAMGGEGAMRAWARARPPLAVPDYRHATPRGYEVISNLFYKALLEAFAKHLD